MSARDEVEHLRQVLADVDRAYSSLMDEVQRYAEGTERPVLWSVYNAMHSRAAWAEGELVRIRADMDKQNGQEPGTPTPLRWGPDDAELGDDGSVTLWLSGPFGEPYALEMEPERAAELRTMLADYSTWDCSCEPVSEHDDLALPASHLHQVGCPVAEREQEAGRG